MLFMKILIYTKTSCPWCIAVTNFLNEKGINYEEKNVSENEDYMKELEDRTGQNYAPTLDIDGDIYPDSDVDELEEVLKKKGILE